MSKLVKILLVLLVLLFVAALILWGYIPMYLSRALSKKAGVPVKIESLQLAPGNVDIERFYVGNPKKSALPTALKVRKISVNAPLRRYLSQNIVIDDISCNDIYFSLEFEKEGQPKGNWTTIIENLERSGKESSTSDTNVLIKTLTLNDIDIDLLYRDKMSRPRRLKPIKQIVLKNISTRGGVPSEQIMRIVMREAIRNILSAEGLKNMLEDLLIQPKDVPNPMNTLKQIFGDASEV